MGDKKSRASNGFGGLADALVKAGIADPKQAVKARNEHRRERRDLGADGIAEQAERRREDFQRSREVQVAGARQRDEEIRGTVDAARVERTIRANSEPSGGGRRWFFVARDGRVPFAEVSPALMKSLEQGDAGIVESPGGNGAIHVVVTGAHNLALVRDFDPTIVRFWNDQRGGRRQPSSSA